MVDVRVMNTKHMTDRGIPLPEQQLIQNAFGYSINDEDELKKVVSNLNELLEGRDSMFEVKYKYLSGSYNVAVFPK